VFAVLIVAVVDGVADVLACGGGAAVRSAGGLGRVELVVEFAAVILEFDELGAEFADPGPALGFR
jgi:hypothetical protein